MLTDFIGTLACPLDFSHSLVVVAKTIDGAKGFRINLRTDKHPESNIGLQLCCRLTEDIIVRNAMVDGETTGEEQDGTLDVNNVRNPIVSGDIFIICIFAGRTRFYISINNKPYCTFDYRFPVQTLQAIEIRGHIQAVTQVDHRMAFPYAWPPVQSIDQKRSFSHYSPIPYPPGHVILITGLCFGNPKGNFVLQFFENDTKRELLHFSARFEPYNVVVRNSMKPNLEYANEEREGGFPFVFDQQFVLSIAFTEKEFLFAVDGKRFCTFGYRTTDLLQNLIGFQITTHQGMHINVTEIDHFQMLDCTCTDFELYAQ